MLSYIRLSSFGTLMLMLLLSVPVRAQEYRRTLDAIAKGATTATWEELKELTASDAASDDVFGRSVAISGDTLVVGAFQNADAGNDSGSAYVFERNLGGPNNWGESKKLTASDAASNDRFGASVAISEDTIVVGSYWDNGVGFDSGSAYVFERNLGGPDNWGESKKLTASDAAAGDSFGLSVAIHGDVIVVASPLDDHAGLQSGSAYIFERNLGGSDNWGERRKLTASDAAAQDRFGFAVAITNDIAIVGASFNDDSSGSAYIFEKNLGGPNNWEERAKLTASDAARSDSFGRKVATNGQSVVVGAPGNDDAGTSSGSAYVFERNLGGTNAWGERTKLVADDAITGDLFGSAVAISAGTIAIGASHNDDAGFSSGSAYVFERDLGGPNQWGQLTKLTASDGALNDEFGVSVGLIGQTAVVGAHRTDDAGTDSGSAYVFQSAPTMSSIEPFLNVPISGDQRIETKFISSIIDHSGVENGYYSRDEIVLAFSGEEGRMEYGENAAPPGYRMDCAGSPFTFNGAINYVGSTDPDAGVGTCPGGGTDADPTHYANYDGHPGTDFRYSIGREITAPADGMLSIPEVDVINGSNGTPSPQEGFNTFVITHPNGLETWYLHSMEGSECLAFFGAECDANDPQRPTFNSPPVAVSTGQIVAKVGATGTGGPHLHFEVRQGDQIIDPFGCVPAVEVIDPDACIGNLWKTTIFADGFESGDLSAWSDSAL